DPGIGMVVGTMFGSMHSIVSFDWSGMTEGPSYVNPMEFPNTVINSASGQAAIRYKLRGLNSTVCAGGTSGLHSLYYGAEAILLGRARMLLAGGVEELCDELVAGFREVGPEGAVPGEGAAMFLLAGREDAASPWFEICGFGSRQSAHGIHDYAAGVDDAV